MMLNIKKIKNNTVTILVAVFCFTTIYSAPTLSRDIFAYVTKKQVGEDYIKQVDCLAKNIYYEAANETYEGKLAVAQVTMNRVSSGQFPKDICAVVYQRTPNNNNSITCQFSWTCLAVSMSKDKYKWEESVIVAKKALTEPHLHDTIAESKALYYHAVYVNPGWNKSKIVKQIGNHIFYTKI